MRIGRAVAVSLILLGSVTLGGASKAPQAGRAVWLNQPYIALVNGHFEGTLTIDEVKRHGNLGIGAINHLDGEFLVLDGVIYQFLTNGGVRTPPGNTRVAFAIMAPSRPGKPIELPAGISLTDLPAFLDAKIPTPNAYYALRLQGTFKAVKARTFPIQKEPFPPVCCLQPPPSVFDLSQIEGTMVGFRSPSYAANVSGPPYHLHFLARSRKAGGHVLDFAAEHATVTLERIDKLSLDLPTDKAFDGMNLETSACPSGQPPVCPAAR